MPSAFEEGDAVVALSAERAVEDALDAVFPPEVVPTTDLDHPTQVPPSFGPRPQGDVADLQRRILAHAEKAMDLGGGASIAGAVLADIVEIHKERLEVVDDLSRIPQS
jgi:hypothetical protein